MAATESVQWRKFSKLVFYSLTTVHIAVAFTAIAIYRNSKWHTHPIRFMTRVWNTFISYNVGSTSPGFFNSVLLSVLGIVIVAVYIGYLKGFTAMTEHMSETAALAIIGVVTVILLVYGTQFVWEAVAVGYQEHTNLTTKVASLEAKNLQMVDPSARDKTITDLKNQLKDVQTQLMDRRQMVVIGDPAFDNISKVLTAFQAYRGTSKGQRCVVYITAPSSSDRVASLVAAFSNSVSGCSTLGPFGSVNEELDEIAITGMKPGILLIHAAQGDLAANLVEEHMSGTIPLERSYRPIPHTSSPLYQNQGMGEAFLWLQFGPDVRWTSELYAGKK
jgi:hypothetical protein